MTLYLPWPLYVLPASGWAGVAVLASLRRRDPASWAILLLVAGGYAPQQSHQVFMDLIALWLLAARGIPVIIPMYLSIRVIESAKSEFFIQLSGQKRH